MQAFTGSVARPEEFLGLFRLWEKLFRLWTSGGKVCRANAPVTRHPIQDVASPSCDDMQVTLSDSDKEGCRVYRTRYALTVTLKTKFAQRRDAMPRAQFERDRGS